MPGRDGQMKGEKHGTYQSSNGRSQWNTGRSVEEHFFSCESMDEDVLVVKGSKRVSGRSSNRRGEDNVISDGSGILVADGSV